MQKEKAAKSGALRTSNRLRDLHSLMVTEDARLNNYVESKFPRLRKLSRRGPRIYKSTYEEGRQTGKKITLHKGVSKQAGNSGRLLT
jgi:hypothetical protein